MKVVVLLCGVPGSGKSTYAKNKTDSLKRNCIIVSRDEIRFSLVPEGEEYFSKENLVFKTFIDKITAAIDDAEHEVVFIDATHLNPSSRKKVLSKIDTENNVVYAANFNVSLEVAIARNNQRTGRACVPESVIRNMWESFIPATEQEEGIDGVIEINE